MAQKSNQENVSSKSHLYSKEQIYSEAHNAVFCIQSVDLINLTDNDINQYKKTFDDNKFEEYLRNKYQDYQPLQKKFRPMKNKPNDQIKRTEDLKLILSREGKTDQYKAQFKSTLSNIKNSCTSSSSASTSACLLLPNTSTASISAESTLPQPTSNIPLNTLSTVEESVIITKPSNLINKKKDENSFNGIIRVKDPKTMMDEMKYKLFMSTFDIKSPRITQVIGGKTFAPINCATPINSATPIKSTTPINTETSTNSAPTLIREKLLLSEIENRKDPTVHTNSVKTIGINKAPVVQNITRSNDGVQWVLASKNVIQTTQVANKNKVQKTASNTTVKLHPASGSSQPLNTFHKTFSNSLIKSVSSKSISSNVSAPKLSFVSSPSTSNGSFGQIIALRPELQAIQPSTTNSIAKSDCSTIIHGNKQLQLINTASLSQMRTVNTQGGSSIELRAQQKPVDSVDRCNARDCKKMASIMCSTCKSVKYCNYECQTKDWYETHIHQCGRL